jgi:hypothetical protein
MDGNNPQAYGPTGQQEMTERTALEKVVNGKTQLMMLDVPKWRQRQCAGM